MDVLRGTDVRTWQRSRQVVVGPSYRIVVYGLMNVWGHLLRKGDVALAFWFVGLSAYHSSKHVASKSLFHYHINKLHHSPPLENRMVGSVYLIVQYHASGC